jgi:ribosomal protein S18 acetylase RimI-like enzyme
MMSATIEFLLNKASAVQIADHLLCCNTDFVPPLRGRVEIRDYSEKIANKAIRFEAWSRGTLVGLVAGYCNDEEQLIAYITSVSVLREWTGKGIAAKLIDQCNEYAKTAGMWRISLEVAADNAPAIKLYEKCGFVADKAEARFVSMTLYLKSREEHDQ